MIIYIFILNSSDANSFTASFIEGVMVYCPVIFQTYCNSHVLYVIR